LRLFSFGGYGLALAALALVVFGAYDSNPSSQRRSNFNSARHPNEASGKKMAVSQIHS